MPHIYLKDFKSNISSLATTVLSQAEAYALKYSLEKTQQIVDELIEKCPPPEELNSINRKLTDLKKVKLGIEKKIVDVEKEILKLEEPIAVTKVSIEILSHFPLPSSVPPGIGIPVGILNTYGNTLEFLRGMVNALEDDKDGIISVIQTAKTAFQPVDIQIARIEALLNRCAEDPNLSRANRKKIIDGLSTDPTLNFPIDFLSKNGKNYKLNIESESTLEINTDKRRAIAIDTNGVTVLQGPFSYAGSTDILLEEIKFRINNQLP